MKTANTKLFRTFCLALLLTLGLALTLTMKSSRASAAAAHHNATRQLSFEERVAYQRAIEEVYWRGRIWPADNPQPKPALDAVMPPSEIEAKVADYLRKSQALEDHWQRPITGQQLQAEMDRMARETKQPAVLAELHRALGNDPFVIAECLARPTLVERLIRNWYAHDERFHGELKQRAERELAMRNTAPQLRQAGGEYAEIEWTRGERAESHRRGAGVKAVTMNAEEWEAQARHFGQLREDEARFYVTMALEQGKDRMKVAVVEWRKEPFDQWWAKAGGHTEMAEMAEKSEMAQSATGYEYRLRSLFAAGADNTWAILSGAPAERYEHTAVWTGSEMIVWGGQVSGSLFNTGGRYNPATDTWTITSLTGAPTARTQHTAIWTGSEMIVWGGLDNTFTPVNTGGRYNPASDSWTATNTVGAPAARNSHTAVWTGSEMIVWGGFDSAFTGVASGGRYNPVSNTWTATSLTGAPAGRRRHTAVWTGNEMIVWGGQDSSFSNLNTGGRYTPATNSWTATNGAGVPTARNDQTAVWTGSEMIVWGGQDSGVFDTGGRYNPGTNSWVAINTTGAPTARHRQTAVWTGGEMIVWGGRHPSLGHFNTGGRYNPAGDSWVATNITGAPAAREIHKTIWTGSEMIVWGGQTSGGIYLNTGGRYDPASDSWIATSGSTLDTPTARNEHTAVWTGSEMIVWGGQGSSSVFNTGGRYNPTTGGWTPTNTTGAPAARHRHTAVWTGSEMIVWGGLNNGVVLNTGGRYNPGTNSWVGASLASAPTARDEHTAVWTGSEMIVWGGDDSISIFNTGGRYNPASDSWIATNTVGAPAARLDHTAVWTGSEMIVWGGQESSGVSNTGSRYNPGADTWTATSLIGVPTARTQHTAVWTGSEMIIWGGSSNTGGRYNPASDSWIAIGTVGAPAARTQHTVVWTGSEMIVWGGVDGGFSFLNTGGRYNPASNNWTATSLTDAPAARRRHTAVWTGNEMIVWGGDDASNNLNTGGRYFAQAGAVNTPPTIAGTALTRTAGSPAADSQIAAVDDAEDPKASLTVTVNGGASATVNGVAVSGLSVNSSGQVTASVGASCTATTAAFTLRVTDSGGLFDEATLDVTVIPNPPPSLGTYPATSVTAGGGATVTPNAAPSDNGSVASLTASAPGFSGTLVGNTATGAITITNANPVGSYTVTVTATDNCGATSTATFALTVTAANAPPTITGATISRQKGSPASTSQIATVGDANQACNTLGVTASLASGSGVTLSGISVNASCQVTASVAASCTATNSTFNLTVTDNQGATATALLTVNVTNNTPPSLGTYPATSATAGGGATVTPNASPSDNGMVASLTASAPGFSGTLVGNTATGAITITNANPVGSYTVTVTATDNCGAQTTRTFTLTVTTTGCSVTVNPATLKQPYVAVPYVELLSASPAANPGSYTFGVSAGALPPGLQLVTALGVTSIAGLPTAPGTYNFTIKAKRNGTTCEGTRSYTVTIPATVVPILECVKRNANGSYTARFGYNNSTGAAVTIPVGANNYFTPGNQNRGQTTVFQPGRVVNAFSVIFKANGSNLAVWFLKGPDGVLRSVNVRTTSIGCP